MNSIVEKNHFMFDTAVPHQEFQHIGKIPANEIHSLVSGQNEFCVEDFFYAIFVFTSAEITRKRIKLAINKYLEIKNTRHGLLSRTKSYAYHIQWFSNYRNSLSNRIVRFDNQDPHYKHETDNHFHCQLQYGNSQKRGLMPTPAHVGDGFPYLSDVLELCYKLLQLNHDKMHYQATSSLLNLPDSDKQNPSTWVPKIGSFSKLLRFLC